MADNSKKPDVSVVKDEGLSSPYNPRYVIVNKVTGKVLDNAQGYGYRTVQKAYAAWNYKNRDKSKDREKVKRRKAVIRWLTEHKDFADAMETYAFEIEKGSWGKEEKFNAAFVKKMLKDFNLETEFTPGEILKACENQQVTAHGSRT